MNKYITPTINIEKVQIDDVIMSSVNAVTYGELEGIDNGESKTAIFDVKHWLN